MADGVPVRISQDLAERARTTAHAQERSVAEQVEHWARLGQEVERVIMSATAERLKARGNDRGLDDRLAFAATPAGRKKAVRLIRSRRRTPRKRP